MNDESRIRQLFADNLHIFSALGDPIRQRLMLLILDGSNRTVAELAAEVGLARPTISHHLRVLKDAGILYSQKRGVHVYYQPAAGTYLRDLRQLVDCIEAVNNNKEHN